MLLLCSLLEARPCSRQITLKPVPTLDAAAVWFHSSCVYVQQVAPSLKQEVVELLDVLLDLHKAYLPEGNAEHAVEIAQLSRTVIHLSRPRLVQQMAALLTPLLSSYGATLSRTDRALGRLLRNVNGLLVQAQPQWATQLNQVQQQALKRQHQVGSSSSWGLVNSLLLWAASCPSTAAGAGNAALGGPSAASCNAGSLGILMEQGTQRHSGPRLTVCCALSC